MSIDETMKRAASVFTAATVCALVYTGAHAAIPGSAFAETYQPVPAVVANQSQVVYYRAGTAGQQASAANVYVDSEFHASLLPGAFTVLCIAPGVHELNASVNDAPRYDGKRAQSQTSLEGGKTYFLKVSENGALLPKEVNRVDAERELTNSQRQVHLLSRASAAMECNYTATVMAQAYTLYGNAASALGETGHPARSAQGRGTVAVVSSQSTKDGVGLDLMDAVGRINVVDQDAGNGAAGTSRTGGVEDAS
ncbi:MAG: hypothetical protein DI584_10750 [Stenotrophomonas sp.]|jgi:OOP family OmpA-OmpF porin|nr:MAG: hypothetical protein DI584_10750 [Stenotrophomonas sp.]